MTSRIPVLTDAVEALLFPQTQRRELARLAHWSRCPFAQHYRERAAEAGIFRAAKQLRKQGMPLDTALSVLAHRGRG